MVPKPSLSNAVIQPLLVSDPLFQLLEAIHGYGAFDIDLLHRRVHLTPGLLKRFGLHKDATLGDAFAKVHPEDQDQYRETVASALKSSSRFYAEYRYFSTEGTICWHNIHGRILRDDSGIPVRLLGIALDVTDRKQAEAKKRSAEEAMHAVMNAIPESFIAVNRDWEIIFANDRVRQKLRTGEAQLEGKILWDATPASMAANFRRQYEAVMRDRKPVRFETHSPRGDNEEEEWFEVHAFPIPDGLGAMIRDISEHKRAQKEVERTVQRLRRVQELGKIASWELDLATGNLEWSENAAEVFQHSPLRTTLQGFLATVHPEDRPMIDSALQRFTREPIMLECRVLEDSGRTSWVAIHTTPVVENGRVIVVGAASDITDAKASEAALVRTEKLAAAGRLAATVSHEINNPLEAVSNFLYLIRTEASASSAVREYAEQAEHELARVAQITRQTLGFYRGSGDVTRFSLRKSLEQLFAIYERQAQRRAICLKFSCDDEQIIANAGEVRQILSNLMANAIDAAPHAGQVCVAVRVNKDTLGMTVDDSGPGIPPESRQRIFAPFYTTKEDFGTGLGLWITQEIVQRTGGTISVSNSSLGGACFEVVLPIRY
jgi:PAS domain S-box-containing protein